MVGSTPCRASDSSTICEMFTICDSNILYGQVKPVILTTRKPRPHQAWFSHHSCTTNIPEESGSGHRGLRLRAAPGHLWPGAPSRLLCCLVAPDYPTTTERCSVEPG